MRVSSKGFFVRFLSGTLVAFVMIPLSACIFDTQPSVNGKGYAGSPQPIKKKIEDVVSTYPHDPTHEVYCRSVDPLMEVEAHQINPNYPLTDPALEIAVREVNASTFDFQFNVFSQPSIHSPLIEFPKWEQEEQVPGGYRGYAVTSGIYDVLLFVNVGTLVLENYSFGVTRVAVGDKVFERNVLCEIGPSLKSKLESLEPLEASESNFAVEAVDFSKMLLLPNEMRGSWYAPCRSQLFINSTAWIDMLPDRIVIKELIHGDTQCTLPLFLSTSTLLLRDYNPPSNGVFTANFMLLGITYIFSEQTGASLANASKLCGIFGNGSDPGWQPLVYREVSGLHCLGSTLPVQGSILPSSFHQNADVLTTNEGRVFSRFNPSLHPQAPEVSE